MHLLIQGEKTKKARVLKNIYGLEKTTHNLVIGLFYKLLFRKIRLALKKSLKTQEHMGVSLIEADRVHAYLGTKQTGSPQTHKLFEVPSTRLIHLEYK